MPVYGIQGSAEHPEHGRRTFRKEITERNAREAEAAFRGWFLVEGYDVLNARFDVITDGTTFADHMAQELRDAGARLSSRHGVRVVGPDAWREYEGAPFRAAMSLWLPNGWAVSLASRMGDQFFVRTEMVTGREGADGGFEVDFSAGVLEYESGVSVTEGFDGEISAVIEALARLPRR